jgi:beta-D-galactosyl-(1->4)-L-rhamnose phosphorylase
MKPKPGLTGDFTMPGEAGYETTTLRLAREWGADTIRDSDGTQLSPELLESGMAVYSTICLVRSVNEWASRNPDKLQQSYLMSFPVMATGNEVEIRLLDGFSRDQFRLNTDDDPKEWWQAHDRTAGVEVPAGDWTCADGSVRIRGAVPGREYTVDFLAYRVWEEISMYNHVTNNWGDRERLAAVEPAHHETQEVLIDFLRRWLAAHPRTNVVRFTSLFYNFAWFWGDDPELRFVYSDWASYSMTTSPCLLRRFEEERGYRPKAEDFVAAGRYNSTHNPPSKIYLEWMDFVHGFVVEFGRRCVDLVHAAGKKAFLFYDDHWVGAEPYSPRFREIGFDGIIKCVFNAFEVRLCAGVQGVSTREIRLHPYLFPTGLKGEPTFAPGGNPARDAWRYWVVARRALLRASVDRIGLGGYPHLAEPFPDFVECVARIAAQFRTLKALHAAGKPWVASCRVGIVTAWGSLRSWSCSGHLHEHPELELLRVIEALAGLPFDVRFLSFQDVLDPEALSGVDVLVNAGRAGSAWSGGAQWSDPRVVERISEWVGRGGGLVGVGEPSAAPGGLRTFRLAPVLGVDAEIGETICGGKRPVVAGSAGHFVGADFGQGRPRFVRDTPGIYPIEKNTGIVAAAGESIQVAVHEFGKGRAVYLSGFDSSAPCHRLIHRALLWAAAREKELETWTPSSIDVECASFAAIRTVVVVNNCENEVRTHFRDGAGRQHQVAIPGLGLEFLEV